MWTRLVVVVIVAAGILICMTPTQTPAPVPARLIGDWPYDKLLKHADLVVFTEAIKTDAADDKPPTQSWNYEFVAQTTTFKVMHALKGKAEDEQIKVLHFKFGELKKEFDPKNFTDRLIENGPMLVAFRSRAVIVKAKGEEENTVLPTPEYLLFLKRMKDGRYEPVSGRLDPAQSVREVSGRSSYLAACPSSPLGWQRRKSNRSCTSRPATLW